MRSQLPALLLEGLFKKDQGTESDDDYKKSLEKAKEQLKNRG